MQRLEKAKNKFIFFKMIQDSNCHLDLISQGPLTSDRQSEMVEDLLYQTGQTPIIYLMIHRTWKIHSPIMDTKK